MRRRPLEKADDREVRELPSESSQRLTELQETTGEAETRPTIAELLGRVAIWKAQIIEAGGREKL